MPAHRTERWTLARLCVAMVLLTACASSPQRSARRELRFDTETVGRIRHAAAAGKASSAVAPAAARTVASQLAEFAPVLLTLLDNDNAVGSSRSNSRSAPGWPSTRSTRSISATALRRGKSAARR